jgi:hypothetical protein
MSPYDNMPDDAVDAARYRWLRDHPDGFQSAAAMLARPLTAEEGRMWGEAHPWGGSPKRYPLALDAVIDAAMARHRRRSPEAG